MSPPPGLPRRLVLPGLGALWLAGCEGPVAGPRLASASGEEGAGGIGGTGFRRAGLPGGDEGGIGGTGIFGTVTGLGSLLVNGLRVETTAATIIEALAGRAGRIAPGDTVAVEAAVLPVEGPAPRLVARRVAVFHPIAGPLQATAPAPGGGAVLTILGTRVLLPADAPLRDPAGAPLPLSRLVPGTPLVVSGLWRQREVVATSLTLAGSLPEAAVRGLLRRPDLRARIGGTRIDDRGLRAPLPEGVFATVAGLPLPDGSGLRAGAAVLEPLAVFSGEVGPLSVEGFLAPDEDGPGVHLAGFGLPLDPSGPIPPPVGERRLFLGRYRRSFRVADSLPLPAEEAARRAALASGAPAIRRWLAGAEGGGAG